MTSEHYCFDLCTYLIFSALGPSLESDIHRRQIVTSKDYPRIKRIKQIIMTVDP